MRNFCMPPMSVLGGWSVYSEPSHGIVAIDLIYLVGYGGLTDLDCVNLFL